VHPDTDRILILLMGEGAFRAQRMAAEAAQVDVRARISKGLYEAERVLSEVGKLFFLKNPHLDRAPYAYFLIYNVQTALHDVNVQVGNAGIAATRPRAYAQIVSGLIERRRSGP
jgi:hypothetical protein